MHAYRTRQRWRSAFLAMVTVRITIYGNADVCQKWQGAPKGEEPTLIGTGADGVHCIYRESDITRR